MLPENVHSSNSHSPAVTCTPPPRPPGVTPGPARLVVKSHRTKRASSDSISTAPPLPGMFDKPKPPAALPSKVQSLATSVPLFVLMAPPKPAPFEWNVHRFRIRVPFARIAAPMLSELL